MPYAASHAHCPVRHFTIGLAIATLSHLGATPGLSQSLSQEKGPDGTPLACNFHFSLRGTPDSRPGVASLDASTDCDSYHIYLKNHPRDRIQSTFSIAEAGSTGPRTYHLSDMPLDEVLLLLEPNGQPTRVLARRGIDRINFIVGRLPFRATPPRALAPRSPGRHQEDAARAGTAPPSVKALLGEWRTQGVILMLRPDGTFSKVSNSSYGGFGGIIGVDDGGTYEVRGNEIVFRGVMPTPRTCSFVLTGWDQLSLCGQSYRKQ
jgi:hypothetical protein